MVTACVLVLAVCRMASLLCTWRPRRTTWRLFGFFWRTAPARASPQRYSKCVHILLLLYVQLSVQDISMPLPRSCVLYISTNQIHLLFSSSFQSPTFTLHLPVSSSVRPLVLSLSFFPHWLCLTLSRCSSLCLPLCLLMRA